MNHDSNNVHSEQDASRTQEFVSHHRFAFMIIGSVIIAIILVLISLALYASSGTSQLDLSRPSYAEIRKQVKKEDNFQGFPSSGALDEQSLQEFEKLYGKRLKSAEAVDAYGEDVLSPEALLATPAGE